MFPVDVHICQSFGRSFTFIVAMISYGAQGRSQYAVCFDPRGDGSNRNMLNDSYSGGPLCLLQISRVHTASQGVGFNVSAIWNNYGPRNPENVRKMNDHTMTDHTLEDSDDEGKHEVTPEVAKEVEDAVSKAVQEKPSSDKSIVARSNTSNASHGRDDNSNSVRLSNESNQTEQVHHHHRKPFVNVKANTSANMTSVEVEIESPYFIISVYLLLYAPILMAWAAVFHYETQDRHYLLVLSASVCATSVGFDLVCQSLLMLMHAPVAITCAQAAGLTLITAFWLVGQEVADPQLSCRSLRPLLCWCTVALTFTVFQVVNHFVFNLCSLSERTVFSNLCPVVALLLESSFLFPGNVQTRTSFNSKLALAAMTVGAIIFSIQYPNFTARGVAASCIFVFVMVPYRILQRFMLRTYFELPVLLLTCCDGAFLFITSFGFSLPQTSYLWGMWFEWFQAPSILLMFILSILTFTANHLCSMLLVRASSATTFLVFQNLASFLVVTLGWLGFGDQIFGSPLVIIGLSICLLSGLWYAIEVQAQAHVAFDITKYKD